MQKEQKDAVKKATAQLKKELDEVRGKLKAVEEENKKLDEARAAAVRAEDGLAEE